MIREHALIKRWLQILTKAIVRVRTTQSIDPMMFDIFVDFFESYVDRTHHDKEERIFFAELQKKQISPEHKEVMDRLITEHVQARETVGKIVLKKNEYIQKNGESINELLKYMEFFAELYPEHIHVEDDKFFVEAINYFTPEEVAAMEAQFAQTQPEMAMEKYIAIVESLEAQFK